METDGQSLDSLGYEVVIAAFVPVHHDAQIFRVRGKKPNQLPDRQVAAFSGSLGHRGLAAV